MSGGVSGVSGAGAADWTARQRAGTSQAPFTPDASADSRSSQSTDLHLPEEQAFKVSTINERLASTAARAEGAAGSRLDLKA